MPLCAFVFPPDDEHSVLGSYMHNNAPAIPRNVYWPVSTFETNFQVSNAQPELFERRGDTQSK